MAHRFVIDCDRMRVTAYTLDGTCVVFQGNRHDASPYTVYYFTMAWAVDGLAS